MSSYTSPPFYQGAQPSPCCKDSVHEAGMEDYGSRGSGREEDLEYISISVKKDFVETAEVIHVKLSNISQQLTGPWTGKIEVRR